jgi:lipopolysaccharide transport system ATP-binding protein
MIHFSAVSKIYSSKAVHNKTLREIFSFSKQKNPLNNENENFIAATDISFSIAKGESVAIVGHNGAGKSTLLKLLTQIILPSSGRIKVNGSYSCLLEVGTGFHHELTGSENIYLSGAILGMSHDEVKKKMDDIIAFSEIGNFIDVPVKFYSSGMYLRLAFAIGVHLDSDILVIDEALAVGDSQFQAKCIEKIKQIKLEGENHCFG